MGRYYDRAGEPLDLMSWAAEFERPEVKIVKRTVMGEVTVSTVWMGLDHQFGVGPPLIFETMVFGGAHDQWQARYSTLKQAQAGHAATVIWVLGEGEEPS